jgi:hypothetical protein
MRKSSSRIATFVLSVALVFCAFAAYAEEQYQTEVLANYFRLDADQDARTIMYGFSAAVFFEPVKTADHPYALAAFLERIGSVFASAGHEDSKSGPWEGKGPMLVAGVNYAKPGFPLAIQAMYVTSKIDFGAPFNGNVKSNSYSLSVGNYFTNNLLAGVGYSYSKTDSSFSGFLSGSANTKGYDLFVNYVYELEHGRELAFAGDMGKSRSDYLIETVSNTEVALSVDYFFNRSLSAGVGIANSSSKDDNNNEGRTYSANVRYFITPRFSVLATYDRFLNAHPGLLNDKSFGATLAARF